MRQPDSFIEVIEVRELFFDVLKALLASILSQSQVHFKYLEKSRMMSPSNLSILLQFQVMLHETIRNDDFQRNTALQHCCDIVSNSYSIVPTLFRIVTALFQHCFEQLQHCSNIVLNSCNIVPTLQRCVALNIVVANRPCNITFISRLAAGPRIVYTSGIEGLQKGSSIPISRPEISCNLITPRVIFGISLSCLLSIPKLVPILLQNPESRTSNKGNPGSRKTYWGTSEKSVFT